MHKFIFLALPYAVLTLEQYIAASVSDIDNILPTSRKQMFYIPRQCFLTYFK